MKRLSLIAVLSVVLTGCAHGPRRQSAHELFVPAAPSLDATPTATPFSAGVLIGGGLQLDSKAFVPAQVVAGSLKVADVGPRALNVLALGGVSASPVQEARGAWGFGAAIELTPGNLSYEVDGALGLIWISGQQSPAALAGVVVTPKM